MENKKWYQTSPASSAALDIVVRELEKILWPIHQGLHSAYSEAYYEKAISQNINQACKVKVKHITNEEGKIESTFVSAIFEVADGTIVVNVSTYMVYFLPSIKIYYIDNQNNKTVIYTSNLGEEIGKTIWEWCRTHK